MQTFSAVLSIRPKNDGNNNAATDQEMQDTEGVAPTDQVNGGTVDPTLTNQANEESHVTEPPNVTEAPVLLQQETDKHFKLTEAIPSAGFRFPAEYKGKSTIQGRFKYDNRVARALHADMKIIHKRHVQAVISPVFHQAADLVKSGYMWQMARREDVTQEEGRDLWERFLGKLRVHIHCRKWPLKLSEAQFSHFSLHWQTPGGLVFTSRRGMGDNLGCWLRISPSSWMRRRRLAFPGPMEARLSNAATLMRTSKYRRDIGLEFILL
jgi:hypothetical protein